MITALNLTGLVKTSRVLTKPILQSLMMCGIFLCADSLQAGQKLFVDGNGFNIGGKVLEETVIVKNLTANDTSQYQNVKSTSGTPRLTSGLHSWAVVTDNLGGGLAMFDIVCGGMQWGPPTGSLFVRLKKTLLD